jgi:hypothetical protein
MGIYPTLSKSTVQFNHHTGEQTWTEYRETPGLVEQRTVTATRWETKERTDCYCCSCHDDRPGSDPACRNHGFAAQRPCETHNLPGQTWGDEAGPALNGKMPLSVQQYRAGNRSL